MKVKHIIYSFLLLFLFCNNIYSQSSLEAKFVASQYEIIAGSYVNFTDVSSGGPTYWKWTFDGAQTPESYDQHPQNIKYVTPGKYDVILEAQNTYYTDTEIVKGCITVRENSEPIANFTADLTLVPVGIPIQFTDLSTKGPFATYEWTFWGGTPSQSNEQTPEPVVYSEPGSYRVRLTVTTANGNIYFSELQNYIKVVSESSIDPIADFIADKTYIAPGDYVNFKEISKGSPYLFSWKFNGGNPATSTKQNPSAVQFNIAGQYDVTLIVQNSLGVDTIVKEKYITVAKTDPCTAAPIVDFSVTRQLISIGDIVNFQDKSLNNPTEWVWTFDGGSPLNSGSANPIRGIAYNSPGLYSVTLSVRNECGEHFLTKENYIRVLTEPIARFCDNISNIENTQGVTNPTASGLSWGCIGGHNSQRIRTYAEKFNQHSYTEIDHLKIPVTRSRALENSSYVTFYIWDGNTNYPETILAQKRVYIRDLPRNYVADIKFDKVVEVDGPFFAGYRISYAGGSASADINDEFAVGIVDWGANAQHKNTLYIEEPGGTWKTLYEKYNTNASSAIQAEGCLVEIQPIDLESNISIYPNPANNVIYIKTNELSYNEKAIVQLIDITGKILHTENVNLYDEEIRLNISNYKEGLYFVNLIIDKSKVTRKIIISR